MAGATRGQGANFRQLHSRPLAAVPFPLGRTPLQWIRSGGLSVCANCSYYCFSNCPTPHFAVSPMLIRKGLALLIKQLSGEL